MNEEFLHIAVIDSEVSLGERVPFMANAVSYVQIWRRNSSASFSGRLLTRCAGTQICPEPKTSSFAWVDTHEAAAVVEAEAAIDGEILERLAAAILMTSESIPEEAVGEIV